MGVQSQYRMFLLNAVIWAYRHNYRIDDNDWREVVDRYGKSRSSAASMCRFG